MSVTESTPTTAARTDLPAEMTDDKWGALVDRLNQQSVAPGRHFDAYLDIAWDEPEYAIDPVDPRWRLGEKEPFGQTAWYQALPADTQARIGLHAIAAKMRTGLQFESVLQRGLLEFAAELPNQTNEFRYSLHEVIEESQHSLMFQEFVNRTGVDVPGMPWDAKLGSRFIIPLGRRFPELFFMFVIGGEDPIDHVQRQALKNNDDLHPLLERIMKIHVTEEARHLSFARHLLKNRVPSLSRARKVALSIMTPLILGEMGRMMIQPSTDLVKAYDIPKAVIHEAYVENPQARQDAIDSMRKIRKLCRELGLMGPVATRLWKAKGIYSAD